MIFSLFMIMHTAILSLTEHLEEASLQHQGKRDRSGVLQPFQILQCYRCKAQLSGRSAGRDRSTSQAEKPNLISACSCHFRKPLLQRLEGPLDSVKEQCQMYEERRDALCQGLRNIGWELPNGKGTMFVWAKIPGGRTDSMAFCMELMEKPASS